jgi:hypothetical protein
MKKLLSLLILSILIIGCSKNETESNRHLTFTNFNNGTYKAELTNNHTKIEYTLKCLTKKLDETVYHDDTCGYGVGDSFDENSGFNVDNHKFKEISFFDLGKIFAIGCTGSCLSYFYAMFLMYLEANTQIKVHE